MVDQVAADLELLGITGISDEILGRIIEETNEAVPDRDLVDIVFGAVGSAVTSWVSSQRNSQLELIKSYLPDLTTSSVLDAKTTAEALRQAGVPRSRVRTTKNPVGAAVARYENAGEAWQRYQLLDRGRWWRTLAETGGDGAFKTWVGRWAPRIGEENADGLAWGLIKMESQQHLGLVWKIIHRMSDSYPDHSPQDMFGWGWYGLTQAIRGYEPEAAAFSTYAARRINGAIRDGIRGENHLPKRLTSVVREIAGAEEDLAHDLGRSPSLEELASHVGATLAELELAKSRYQVPASIEELMTTSDESGDEVGVERALGWDYQASEDPEEMALASVQADAVQEAVASLPEDEREAVRLLVFEGRSTAEAAEICRMTPRQVRRARDRGLEIISEVLKTWAAA